MTDDETTVARGLALLADEAEPASIDSHTVVTLARARTRGRRAMVASAVATVAAVGALAVAVSAMREPPPPGRGDDTVTTTTQATGSSSSPSGSSAPPAPEPGAENREGPVMGTEVERPASPEERTRRAQRLQAEAATAFEGIPPDGWQHSTFAFTCDEYGCWAEGSIEDAAGPVRLRVHVSGGFGLASCQGEGCTKKIMADGTLVTFATGEEEGFGSGPVQRASVGSVRTDGTSISLSAEWPVTRPEPPLTDDQWRAFGTAFTY